MEGGVVASATVCIGSGLALSACQTNRHLLPQSPPEADADLVAASGGCYDLVNYVAWEARVLVSSVNLVLRQRGNGTTAGSLCLALSRLVLMGRLDYGACVASRKS